MEKMMKKMVENGVTILDLVSAIDEILEDETIEPYVYQNDEIDERNWKLITEKAIEIRKDAEENPLEWWEI